MFFPLRPDSQRPAIVVVAPLEALLRGPGFDPPWGRISALGLKKLPRLSHVQNTVEPGLTHKATPPVYGWGRGSGVFLGCCEKVILPLKQCRGGSLTPRRSSFVSPIIVKLIVPFGISSLVERKRKTKHIATQKKSIKFVSQLATIGDFVNINIRRFSLFFMCACIYIRVNCTPGPRTCSYIPLRSPNSQIV